MLTNPRFRMSQKRISGLCAAAVLRICLKGYVLRHGSRIWLGHVTDITDFARCERSLSSVESGNGLKLLPDIQPLFRMTVGHAGKLGLLLLAILFWCAWFSYPNRWHFQVILFPEHEVERIVPGQRGILVDHVWECSVVPLVVSRVHLFRKFRVFIDHIVFLGGVLFHVVECVTTYESESLVANRESVIA